MILYHIYLYYTLFFSKRKLIPQRKTEQKVEIYFNFIGKYLPSTMAEML